MMTLRILLATTALAAAPALAQTAPSSTQPAAGQSGAASAATGTASGQAGTATGGAIAQGATIYDPQGGTVGRIESLSGDMVVVATQKSKVQLPKSSFATGPKGPVIAMTAAQLDQAAAQASPGGAAGATASGGAAGATGAATGKPNVAQGAAVSDTQGGAVGTVSEVDPQYATVTLTTGGKVRLPVSAFGAAPNGGLRVSMTAAQLSAAAGGSSSSTTSAKGGKTGS